MNAVSPPRYLPAIICAVFDSPIDALVGVHVAHDEAMELVAAAWHRGHATCVLAEVDGGRAVAAIRLADGRWAACNVFPEALCASLADAERQLKKRLKRRRQGCIGCL